MVPDHHYRIVAESIGFHHLANTFIIGPHPATDEADISGRDVVAAFKASFSTDTQDRTTPEMGVAQLDDIRFSDPLGTVHPADHVSARSRDTLVAGEIEVHQGFEDILGIVARIAPCVMKLHLRPEKDTTDEVCTAQCHEGLLPVGFRLLCILPWVSGNIICQHGIRQGPKAVDIHFIQDAPDCVDPDSKAGKDFHVVNMFRGSLVDVEITLEQTRSRMDDPVEDFFSRGVHQHLLCRQPLSPGESLLPHFTMPAIIAKSHFNSIRTANIAE